MPRIPNKSKWYSHFSYAPNYNLPRMTGNFKDFADSYINHHDFPSGAEGSNLVWWPPCFLAKKTTKLPTRQVAWRTAPVQTFCSTEEMGQPKKYQFPRWKAGTHILRQPLPAPVWAREPHYSHLRCSCRTKEWRLTCSSLRVRVRSRENKGQTVEISKLTCNYFKCFYL